MKLSLKRSNKLAWYSPSSISPFWRTWMKTIQRTFQEIISLLSPTYVLTTILSFFGCNSPCDILTFDFSKVLGELCAQIVRRPQRNQLTTSLPPKLMVQSVRSISQVIFGLSDGFFQRIFQKKYSLSSGWNSFVSIFAKIT